MNNENGVARIAVIIVVIILLIAAFFYFNRNNEFEKIENDVVGYTNVVADKIQEKNVNAPVEIIDTTNQYIIDENGKVNAESIPEGKLDAVPEVEFQIDIDKE